MPFLFDIASFNSRDYIQIPLSILLKKANTEGRLSNFYFLTETFFSAIFFLGFISFSKI
jgi:hypothetical protein